jgi:glycosyltransferase involved in cell wall biosynthesis
LRACFLIHELGRAGGMQTIQRYARALDAELVFTDPRGRDLPDRVDGVRVRRLADAREERYDCAIATWWSTAEALWELDAGRRLVFLQSIESRFYEERHFYERFAAEHALTLPVGYVVVASWLERLLAELRPDAPCVVVRNGIDKEAFGAHRPALASHSEADPGQRSALRVLIEGQPSLWFKGVEDALAAVGGMSEPVEATVAAGDLDTAGEIEGARLVGGLDGAGMAALYAEHDLVLKLSRVESLGLAPIEAFHVGVPAVVTPYTGHEEYMEHGRNGLVVGYDDVPGTARALDALARDRRALAELAEGALATAADWPSADAAASEFARAVEGMRAAPQPDEAAARRHLGHAQRRWLELAREHARQDAAVAQGLRGAVRWHEDAMAQAREHIDELHELRDAAHDREMKALREMKEVRASRVYRALVAARRLKPGGRG